MDAPLGFYLDRSSIFRSFDVSIPPQNANTHKNNTGPNPGDGPMGTLPLLGLAATPPPPPLARGPQPEGVRRQGRPDPRLRFGLRAVRFVFVCLRGEGCCLDVCVFVCFFGLCVCVFSMGVLHTYISIHEPIHPSLHQSSRPIAIFAGLLALLHRVGVEVGSRFVYFWLYEMYE